MDEDLNVTYITVGGYVGLEQYRYVYFVIIFTVYVLIICCNSTIIWLIVIHQSLYEPMYVFIAALLINSVLFSTAIFPKLLVDFLSERQIISHTMCHLQFFLYYFFGSSEFSLLVAMAYDRYVSICKPLQYPTIMRKHTVCAFLALAWLSPACQVAASTALSARSRVCNFTLKAIFCNNSIYNLHCVRSTVLSLYGVVVLFSIIFLPLLYIVFTYTRILVIIYGSGREVRAKAAQTCLPHLLVLLNFSLLCAYDILILRLGSNVPKTARLIMTLQLVLCPPLINPIIYGLKMKEISKHLKKLFCRSSATHR